MKIPALVCTVVAAVAVTASAVPGHEARDTCGADSPDRRRTNSPCGTGNGDRRFCGCDRTDIVQCIAGFWREIHDCGHPTCHGNTDGNAAC